MKSRTRRFARLALVGLAGFGLCWVCFPFPGDRIARLPAAAVVCDRDGEVLRVRLGPEEARCLPVAIEDAGDWLPLALVAVEDKRFFRHPGVDPLALTRAVGQNIWHRRRISGASTISTQVIRLAEPRPRTLPTKVVEAFRALQMEVDWDKADILENYLNHTPYGGNLVGVRAASLHYFGKEPRDLALEEAALLAGLPQAPTRLRPDRDPAGARKRRDHVLERMQAIGAASPARVAAARAEPLRLAYGTRPFLAPHFCDWVGARCPEGRTHTTLDRDLQAEAETVVSRHADRHPGIGGMAVVVIHVPSGELRAMVGSPDYDEPRHGQVNGALALRSPGSALKPFLYALAYERGFRTPAQSINDAPRHFAGYRPGNFDHAFRGETSTGQALRESLNLPALQVLEEVGLEPGLAHLRALGLSSLDRSAASYGLNLALGGCEVRLLDVANAAACLARGGEAKPVSWLPADDRSGERLLSPEACWMVSDSLRDPRPDGREVAWKTGTSARHRDAWTIAWNPEWVVGAWMGQPDGAPCPGMTGRDHAGPLALDVFDRLPGNARFLRPPGLASRRVCIETGLLPGPDCPATLKADAIPRVSPVTRCCAHGDDARPEAPAPAGRLHILEPVNGSTLLRVRGDEQLDLRCNRSGESVHWFVNGRRVSTPWTLEPGSCRISCVAADGRSHAVRIEVEDAR